MTINPPSNVTWAPQPGSQVLFLSCPIKEVLYEGTRGPGKTDALLMSFAKYCGGGYGAAWRGILFRQTYKQLSDIVSKSKKWFSQIFPDAVFNKADMTWTWPDGEELLLRYMDNPDDYWHYHGHEYPWIGWEELTNWPSMDCYESMKSCNRSSDPRVPRMYRSTCNPFGVGHHWVKAHFIDPAPSGTIIVDEKGNKRVSIKGHISENKILVSADPEYLQLLDSVKDDAKRKAWLDGDWDIIAGAMFSDYWDKRYHEIKPFQIPSSWDVKRSYDDGESAPFSVGWWAISDGTEATLNDGTTFCPPRGTHIRIAEWYGWTGEPNEGLRLLPSSIAEGIKDAEEQLREYLCQHVYIEPGPADNTVFDAARGKSVADQMSDRGIYWERSDKRPGSRVAGVKLFKTMLDATLKNSIEDPHFYVFDTCRQWLRTVPPLPRDSKKPDDVNTKVEDHAWDETRYMLLSEETLVQSVSVAGY